MKTPKAKRFALLAMSLLMAPLLSSCGDSGAIYCDSFAEIEDLLFHQYESYPEKRTLHLNFDGGVGLEGIELEEYVFFYSSGNGLIGMYRPSDYEEHVLNSYSLFDREKESDYVFNGWAAYFSYLNHDEWRIILYAVEAEKFVNPALTWEGDELKSDGTAFAAISPPDDMPESDVLRIKADVLDYANASLGI